MLARLLTQSPWFLYTGLVVVFQPTAVLALVLLINVTCAMASTGGEREAW